MADISSNILEIDESMTMISIARLNELELLEKNLPSMIQEAIELNKKEKLKLLHENDKKNPDSVNIRVKRYLLKNKDAINEKRRLKREEEKANKLQGISVSKKPINDLSNNNISNSVIPSTIANDDLTVRF